MEIKLEEQKLRIFCENILKKSGLPSEGAFIVADSLIFANLRGIDSHGIMRFPFYLERLKKRDQMVPTKKGQKSHTVYEGFSRHKHLFQRVIENIAEPEKILDKILR